MQNRLVPARSGTTRASFGVRRCCCCRRYILYTRVSSFYMHTIIIKTGAVRRARAARRERAIPRAAAGEARHQGAAPEQTAVTLSEAAVTVCQLFNQKHLVRHGLAHCTARARHGAPAARRFQRCRGRAWFRRARVTRVHASWVAGGWLSWRRRRPGPRGRGRVGKIEHAVAILSIGNFLFPVIWICKCRVP